MNDKSNEQDSMTGNLPDTIDTKPPRKTIPIELILEYKAKNLTTREIAALVGCDHSNIVRRLQRVSDKIATLPQYKRNLSDVLLVKQREVLNHVTEAKLKDCSGYQLVGMQKLLYDQWRLETDQSTSNVATIHQDIAALKELKRIREEGAEG